MVLAENQKVLQCLLLFNNIWLKICSGYFPKWRGVLPTPITSEITWPIIHLPLTSWVQNSCNTSCNLIF
jgi:hypothetical protein